MMMIVVMIMMMIKTTTTVIMGPMLSQILSFSYATAYIALRCTSFESFDFDSFKVLHSSWQYEVLLQPTEVQWAISSSHCGTVEDPESSGT